MKFYSGLLFFTTVTSALLIVQNICDANPYLPARSPFSKRNVADSNVPSKDSAVIYHFQDARSNRLRRQSQSTFGSLGELAAEFMRRGGLQAVLAMAESNNKMETLTRIMGAHVMNGLSQSLITKLLNKFSGNKGSSGGGGGGYAPAPSAGSGGSGGRTGTSSGTGYVPTPGKTPGAANPDDTEY